MIRFELWPLIQGQMMIANIKSAHNSLICVPRGLQCHTNLLEIMGYESFDVVRFYLGLLLQGLVMVDWRVFFLVDTICIGSPMRYV